MRLFIGIFPPKETRDALRDTLRKFTKHKRNLKFVPVDQMHITLKYIGSRVSFPSYELVRERLIGSQKEHEPVTIDLPTIQFGFPFDRNPRHLLVQVKTSDELTHVAEALHENIKSLKLRDTIRVKGKYSYDFHVTLGRLKDNAAKSMGKHLRDVVKEMSVEIPSFTATEAYLVESILEQGKQPQYRKLERIIL